MSVIPPSFSTLVAHSTQILRVEVVASSSQWDTYPGGKTIHTYVQCSILRTLKGDSAGAITLRFLGGQVGDTHLEVPGLPVLEIGKTYILFVAMNGSAFCPIVAAAHGSYPVVVDAATQAETVLRGNQEPLRSVDDIAKPMRRTLQTEIATPGAPGMSREAFEESIVAEVSRANTH